VVMRNQNLEPPRAQSIRRDRREAQIEISSGMNLEARFVVPSFREARKLGQLSESHPVAKSATRVGQPQLGNFERGWASPHLFIYVPTLVVASERDFWSRPADREKIAHDPVHASVRVVVIPNANHFVHLYGPERGKNQPLNEIVRFVTK
jgi:pimeloyl-ACP methyl ester carboxylesterase